MGSTVETERICAEILEQKVPSPSEQNKPSGHMADIRQLTFRAMMRDRRSELVSLIAVLVLSLP